LFCAQGSSGAGKTTLIDVVAGRKTSGEITGEVLINGQPKSKNEAMFKRITGYCEQRDMHMPLATVRESLMFSATLRLPKTVSPQTRAEFVDELLDILELRTLADRIVGNEKYAGLSPGQLKLLTIGQWKHTHTKLDSDGQSDAAAESRLTFFFFFCLSSFLFFFRCGARCQPRDPVPRRADLWP